jgi:hypothetical protein
LIKTQELKTQIDELTKQNEAVLKELEQVKKMLSQSEKEQDSKGSSSEASSGGQESGGKNNGGVGQLANELLAIKDLVEKLEKKTSQYISNQSSGSLNEKDVVNLILTLMNGMVDWTTEFVSEKASQAKQEQSKSN